MVVLNELTSVFWGVALEGGKKKYSQTTTKPVHISMAALDPTQPCGDSPISVMIEHGTGSYILCTLRKDVIYQQPLNLEFAAGEELSFYIKGNGSVHLSGYFMPEDDYQQYSDMEDDDEDELVSGEEDEESEDESDEDQIKKGKKRQIANVNKNSKKAKFTFDDLSEDDDDDDEDDDFILHEAEEASDDEEDDDDEDDEDDLEESPKPVDKKKKKATSKVAVVNTVKPKGEAATQQIPGKKQDGSQNKKNTQPSTVTVSQPTKTAEGAPDGTEGKKKKKKKKKNKGNNQEQATETSNQASAAAPAPVVSKPPAKRVGEGGVVIEDLKVGHGPEAKVGKMVRVYYTGRLSNGKAFDCCTSGNGFKFKLGKKEVISGWDVGVSGMKVGGKRKLVIPPKMGYGTQKAGVIPPNSTLIFDVELKSVG